MSIIRVHDETLVDLTDEPPEVIEKIEAALRAAGFTDAMNPEVDLSPMDLIKFLTVVQLELEKRHAELEYEHGPEDKARRPYSAKTHVFRYIPDSGQDELKSSEVKSQP